MQILYLINKNEDLNIYNKLFDKIKREEDLLVNCFGKFYRLSNDANDFFYIKNYDVDKILKVENFNNIEKIQNNGFNVIYDDNIQTQNYVYVSKIKAIRHVVKPLQTLNQIAEIYGIDKNQIIYNNQLVCEKLFIGQIIYI